MRLSLPKTVTPQQIAICLGIGERAVRQQANKGHWPKIHQKGRGGASIAFVVSGLPDYIRTAMAAKLPPAHGCAASRAGCARANELTQESQAAIDARRQAKEQGLAAYERLPEEKKRQADARRQILNARDAFITASGLSKKQATTLFIREYQAGAIGLETSVMQALNAKLSWPTLYRWERAYQESGMAGLANGYEATRHTAIADHMQDFIIGLLCARPHLGIPMVRLAVEARFAGQAIPSTSALRRFVANWRQENKSLIQFVTYPDQWRNQHMIALGKADEDITRLNQVWEFDSTPGDVMLADGRHSLIGVIDVYCRRAKLQVTPTSKSAAIAALTRRAILDWGVPEIAKTDNGSDYVSSHMVRVFEDLEIWQELCRPFHPEDKPHIERFFWTLLHGIFELLPGYIGHSVAERKQIESRRSFAKRIMGQGDDPVAINLTAEHLQTICDQWCEAMYHQNPHAGLDGHTPAETARAWTAPIRRIENERALDILLSPAPDKEGTRVITKNGITVQNGTYISAALGPHVGKTVFVLLDATDYGTIHVFLIHRDGSKEFLCQAEDPERTGANRSAIATAAKRYQKQFMQQAAGELKRLSKQAAVDHIHEEILAHRMATMANVHELPRAGVSYTTPAIEEAARAVDDIRRSHMAPEPIAITAEQDASASKLIDMAHLRNAGRPLPATAQEKYEQLYEDLNAGMDLPDKDLAWMKRYEIWLTTGERVTY